MSPSHFLLLGGTMRRLSLRASFISLLGTLTIAACSDTTAPGRTMAPFSGKIAIAGRKDLTSYQYGSLITVVDATGQTLTLDLVANEIRTDDGRVFLLSPDQTAVFATDFANTIIYDGLASEVQTLADHQVCHDTGGCVGEMTHSTPNEGFVRSHINSQRFKSGGLSRRARPSAFGLGLSGTSRRDLSLSGYSTPKFDYLSLMPDCESMKTDIVTAEAAYRSLRGELNHRLLDQGLAAFALTGGRYVLDLTLSGPEVAAVLAAIGADQVNKRSAETQMDIMRVLYTSQSCGTIGFDGASYEGFSYQSVNGHTLICHFEWWTVSFDGGITSRSVGANVCEFAME
jgi:hypothetical protein